MLWSQEVLKQQRLKAVVLNSGGANAATGPAASRTPTPPPKRWPKCCRRGAIEVAVCSTGLIGERLPMDAVLSGVDSALQGARRERRRPSLNAATGVMTTDTQAQAGLRERTDSGWSVGGFAKGAGMLAPNLATMLSVLTTDAVVGQGDPRPGPARGHPRHLRPPRRRRRHVHQRHGAGAGLRRQRRRSRPRPSSPSCSPRSASTWSSSCGRTPRAPPRTSTSPSRARESEADAVAVARTIAEDNLVKTALFGSDPNWGRIAMALGRRPGADRPGDRVDRDQRRHPVRRGMPARRPVRGATSPAAPSRSSIDLGVGGAAATIYTTDLSHGYVEENSAYSS